MRQAVREIKQPEGKGKADPDDAFFEDPSFPALEKLFKVSDWIQGVKIAKRLAERHPDSAAAHFFLGFSLHALLSHFDNMLDDSSTVATPSAVAEPTNPEKLAAGLIAGFLRHGQGSDLQAELADYTPTVNPYFDQGQQTRAAILKDITTYRAKWPRRSLQLVAVESARRDDTDTLAATYRLRYSASDGKKTRTGTLIQGIRYTLKNGRWLVSGIQTIERVAE
jgi:hypothetical protein